MGNTRLGCGGGGRVVFIEPEHVDRADLNRIWEGLSKPPELQDRQLSGSLIWHLLHSHTKFFLPINSSLRLRKHFVDKNSPDYRLCRRLFYLIWSPTLSNLVAYSI
jgi:hypothetical protein